MLTRLQKVELAVIVTLLLAAITFAFWLGSFDTRIRSLENNTNLKELNDSRQRTLDEIRKAAEQVPKPLPTVAFSAVGESHSSQGAPQLLAYETTIGNVGSAWSGQEFTAPRPGTYGFSLGFLRDASDPEFGVANDVHLHLRVNGELRADAWAGEGGGPRQSASVAVMLPLNAGDKVAIFVTSDNGSRRQIRNFWFVGFALQ